MEVCCCYQRKNPVRTGKVVEEINPKEFDRGAIPDFSGQRL